MKQRQRTTVITIRRDCLLSDVDLQIVDLAFSLWLARGFRGGSPQDDLLNASRRVKGSTSSGLFLVPKKQFRGRNVYPLYRA
jgi:hypothetical protein